jgi:hypothetical protein
VKPQKIAISISASKCLDIAKAGKGVKISPSSYTISSITMKTFNRTQRLFNDFAAPGVVKPFSP